MDLNDLNGIKDYSTNEAFRGKRWVVDMLELITEVERCWQLLGINQPAPVPVKYSIDDTVTIKVGYKAYWERQNTRTIALWNDGCVLTVATLEGNDYVWLFDGTYHGRVPSAWVQPYHAG